MFILNPENEYQNEVLAAYFWGKVLERQSDTYNESIQDSTTMWKSQRKQN